MDRIIAAWAGAYTGPGAGNHYIEILVRRTDGSLDLKYIQARDFDESLRTLHPISLAVQNEMLRAVRYHWRENDCPRDTR